MPSTRWATVWSVRAMKLFWKLFCSMVIVTVLGCAVCAFVLIDSQFQSSLDREVASLYQENDLLRYALTVRMETAVLSDREQLAELAKGTAITTGGETVSFRLSDGTGETLGYSGSLPVEADGLIFGLVEHQRGWELQGVGERYYLHAASPLNLLGETVYLENCREVSDLFSAREDQYRSFLYLMPVLTVAAALAALIVAALMLRPLGKLSTAARRMSEGELYQRVKVTSDDEIGHLGQDFNVMAARLEEQVQELKGAVRRQEDFIGSFTHELKTPLTSIIGYAELLRSRPDDQEQVLESAGYIFREGRRLESLSRKLLDLIVLEKQDFARRLIPMDVFLERIGGALRPALEGAGLRLSIQAEAAEIPIDPDLMEAVCLNLLDNARKATERGGEIHLEGAVEEGDYRIQVTDTGKGIPAEDLSRVTEAFYMVDKSRARAQGGAGLGLALCRRIVELHGGTMELESVLGQGTTARVHLKGGEQA